MAGSGFELPILVIPANAGTQAFMFHNRFWVPAFAGMTRISSLYSEVRAEPPPSFRCAKCLARKIAMRLGKYPVMLRGFASFRGDGV